MGLIAEYFVGDIMEFLDDDNHIKLNGVDVYVSDDADVIMVYDEGYIEELHDGGFLLTIENQGYRDINIQRLETILFKWADQ